MNPTKNHIFFLILSFFLLHAKCADDVNKNSDIKKINGQYRFKQHYPSRFCFKNDLSQCKPPDYLWNIVTFEYQVAGDEYFSCYEDNRSNFDINKLLPIKNELFKKWDLEESSAFLNDTWHYNTQCTNYSKEIDGELKYFKKSLELFDKYNMDTILRQSNIFPGNNYTGEAIWNAVTKAINGKTPEIECLGKNPDVDYLFSIGFYLDDSFNPMNRFDNDKSSLYQCLRNKTILYDFPTALIEN